MVVRAVAARSMAGWTRTVAASASSRDAPVASTRSATRRAMASSCAGVAPGCSAKLEKVAPE
jgi:hypothetical protein